MVYRLLIDIEALEDIENAFDWYETQLKNLGSRYRSQVKKQINSLKKNPYLFSIKYHSVHCVKIDKFPFLIHYSINELNKTIAVFAVIHTSRDPEIWLKK